LGGERVNASEIRANPAPSDKLEKNVYFIIRTSSLERTAPGSFFLGSGGNLLPKQDGKAANAVGSKSWPGRVKVMEQNMTLTS
jgi:hypothetical protein